MSHKKSSTRETKLNWIELGKGKLEFSTMRSYILILFLVPSVVLLPCEPFKKSTLAPKDESSKDPSFIAFKTKLLKAVKTKDTQILMESLSPDIRFTFDSVSGKKEFKKHFELNSQPEKSEIWTILDSTFKLGFYLNPEGQFVSPYMYEKFPQELDVFTHSVVIGTNVNVRTEAHIDAKVLDRLSFHIVQNVPSDPNDGSAEDNKGNCNWQKVCLADGREGFICDKYLRSPIDYRIFFEKQKQKWFITTMVAGD
jgi:hypothetical protein